MKSRIFKLSILVKFSFLLLFLLYFPSSSHLSKQKKSSIKSETENNFLEKPNKKQTIFLKNNEKASIVYKNPKRYLAAFDSTVGGFKKIYCSLSSTIIDQLKVSIDYKYFFKIFRLMMYLMFILKAVLLFIQLQ